MSLLKMLQKTFGDKQEESPFSVSKLALSQNSGYLFDSKYNGGTSLTEENISQGKSVVTVKDDRGVVHVLGENFR